MATLAPPKKRFTSFSRELATLDSHLDYRSPMDIRLKAGRPEWVWLYWDRTADPYIRYATWLAIVSLKEKTEFTINDLKVESGQLLDWLSNNTSNRSYCQRYIDELDLFNKPVTFEDLVKGGFFNFYINMIQEVKTKILNHVDTINYVEEKELP